MRSESRTRGLHLLLASLLCLSGLASLRSARASWDIDQVVAASRSTKQTLRVLFIGNSYTYYNNLPALLSALSASRPTTSRIEAEMVTRSGATLRNHWEDGLAIAKLKEGHWDFVVLQEQSTLPINDARTMHKYARLFDGEIKKAGARTVFFLTWARQNRPETQEALNKAYTSIAQELGALLAPVGIAWQAALKLDPNSLLYAMDKSHPNTSGSYLAACVLYSVIVGQSPNRLAGTLVGKPVNAIGTMGTESVELVKLADEEARMLQEVAWETTTDLRNGR